MGAHSEYDYNVTKDYVKDIMDYLQRENTPLLIFVIPDNSESKEQMIKSKNYKRAIDLMRETGANYLDIYDRLTVQDYSDRSIYPDSHWNESGHHKAFMELKAYFERQN